MIDAITSSNENILKYYFLSVSFKRLYQKVLSTGTIHLSFGHYHDIQQKSKMGSLPGNQIETRKNPHILSRNNQAIVLIQSIKTNKKFKERVKCKYVDSCSKSSSLFK